MYVCMYTYIYIYIYIYGDECVYRMEMNVYINMEHGSPGQQLRGPPRSSPPRTMMIMIIIMILIIVIVIVIVIVIMIIIMITILIDIR